MDLRNYLFKNLSDNPQNLTSLSAIHFCSDIGEIEINTFVNLFVKKNICT